MISYDPAIRVAITGIGFRTAIGNNINEIWDSIKNARSGIKPAERIGLKCTAGIVSDSAYKRNRARNFVLEAQEEALKLSQLKSSEIDPARMGSSISTSKGEIEDLFCQKMMWSLSDINLSTLKGYKIFGPSISFVAACATGLHSIACGVRWIKEGRADVVLAGAGDSVLNPFWLGAYQKTGILAKNQDSNDSEKMLKPFDKRRSGTVLGEGCGVIVLERLDLAKRRKAPIYGEIISTYIGIDSFSEVKMSPTGEGVAKALKGLMRNVPTQEVDYINMHGTGTVWNDLVETRGIKLFFGEKTGKMSFSSTKPFTGHTIGASGAIELIISLVAMNHQFIPPTLNLEEPDEECNLDYTPRQGKEINFKNFICLSYGFGGQIGAVLVKKI